MSASINGTTINLTRGDTLDLKLNFTDYTPEEGDSIRFAMKAKISDSTPLLLKQCDMSTLTITIEPEDTKPFDFGKYFYDIELTTKDGIVDTFITKSIFNLTEEVY